MKNSMEVRDAKVTRSRFDAHAAFGCIWDIFGIFLVDVRKSEFFGNSHLKLVCELKRPYA